MQIKRSLASFAVFAALGFTANATAQPAAVTVTVNANDAGTPLKAIWPYFGYDEINYTTTARGRALLSALATTQSSSVFIRTHFLLNTGNGAAIMKWGSTNMYTEDAAGSPVYNFTIHDAVMDAITSAGTLPFVEIGFMPQALSTRPNPYQNTSTHALDGGCFYPPKDYAKWQGLIRAWATHVRDRYPNVENTWQWELWNEPDILYWKGTFQEFATLYDHTEAALHQVLPRAVLGGPAILNPNGTFLREFLEHTASGRNAASGQTGTRLDLISFHAKGGVSLSGGNVRMNLGNQLRLHRAGFTTIASFPQYKQTPIVVSEADPDGCAACTATRVPAAAYRNSTAYGAYEVAMMKRTLELESQLGVNVRGLTTWAFLFEDVPYFAGYRVLESNGIHMPVLNAFKLLGKLAGTRVPITSTGARSLDDVVTNSVRQQPDIDAMATRNGRQVQVLVWNYHDDLVASAPSAITLRVNVPADFGPRATVSHLRVDNAHGDAHSVWVSQGSPATPSAAQLAALRQAMEPAPLEPERSVDVTANAVNLSFPLPRFGISLITLTPPGGGGGAGGAGGNGGASGSSGAAGNAGSAGALGGAAGGGGASGASGTPGGGGTDASGGITGTAGSTTTPGGGTTGIGGAPALGGQLSSGGTPFGAGTAGVVGAAGAPAPGSGDDGGCGCRVPSRSSTAHSTGVLAGLALALGAAFARRKRSGGH